jgi:hypothetical protein
MYGAGTPVAPRGLEELAAGGGELSGGEVEWKLGDSTVWI